MKTIGLCTGGFDPIHIGHINYLKAAKGLVDILVVGVNSDQRLIRKKGKFFLPSHERLAIVDSLKPVDHAFLFNDDDNSAIDAIKKVQAMYPGCKIKFLNGGDRTKDNIPELIVKDIEFVFGVGGDTKTNSSSWILNDWKAPKTIRSWGHWAVIHEQPGIKVKQIKVHPGSALSNQRHNLRDELWFVSKGSARVMINHSDNHFINSHESFFVQANTWHKLVNNSETDNLEIIEIQYGEKCVEEDIERSS
jgi:D-beta-D-heptose 7-phosphate kinase/D-beta-D-heptose 1-phosphate adenosyltransferase